MRGALLNLAAAAAGDSEETPATEVTEAHGHGSRERPRGIRNVACSSPQPEPARSPDVARRGGADDAGMTIEDRPGVDLFWLPLGAGGHSVRVNGRVFEAVAARLAGREPCDLYHSALEVRVPDARFVVEQAPVSGRSRSERGVVAEGAVGSRWAGSLRLFRYEVRCWRDGVIPDADEAVDSPQRLTDDAGVARKVLDLAPRVPTLVWGRDELGVGEMWNSNSIIAWLLAGSGVPVESIRLPAGGRAPGWRAGVVLARRDATAG
jgi:hypothetical protein